MSLDVEERLRRFWASAPQNIHVVQVLSFSNSAMTQTYHLWPERNAGQVVTEDDELIDTMPANMEIKPAGSPANLDQAFDISMSTMDPADTFRKELDSIPINSDEAVRVVYREYLSDDLATPQAVANLEVENIAYTRGAASISAVVPRLNVIRTGELYTLKRFPMLRGFL